MELQSLVEKILEGEIKAINTGTVVATPRGEHGVIFSEEEENFGFPTGPGEDDENVEEIEVDDNEVVVVVGFGGESAAYNISDTRESSFENGDADSGDGEALATVDEVSIEEAADLPEGWDEESLLKWWAGVGGTFEEAVTALEDTDEFGVEDAREQAAAWKDAALGTRRWRGRF